MENQYKNFEIMNTAAAHFFENIAFAGLMNLPKKKKKNSKGASERLLNEKQEEEEKITRMRFCTHGERRIANFVER